MSTILETKTDARVMVEYLNPYDGQWYVAPSFSVERDLPWRSTVDDFGADVARAHAHVENCMKHPDHLTYRVVMQTREIKTEVI